MKRTDTVIIGGGQAGLAMSRSLYEREIDHVVLERGRLGERWRSERWDSLRLLSPNWMARLPHFQYEGDDPDGFMTMPEFTRYLEAYANSFPVPLQSRTNVESVRRGAGGFVVETSRGTWAAQNVVVATGFCDVPRVPAFADRLSPAVHQLVPSDYRNPSQLPAGNVLVVGGSATGAQIAEELLHAGRAVTVAVGTHVRWPRRYRGRDILVWIDSMGGFAAPADPSQERAAPPPQLIGTPENRDLDFGTLQRLGAQLVGRAVEADGDAIRFADDLQATLTRADDGLAELLQKVDGYIEQNGIEAPAKTPLERVVVDSAPTTLSLSAANISTVVWATGYKRRYPWLHLPVLNDSGDIAHVRGETAEQGLWVLGMRFQATKGSNLIDGVGADAEAIADTLAERSRTRQAA